MHASDMVDFPRDLAVARAVGTANQDIECAHAVGDELALKLASLTQTRECLGQCADGDGLCAITVMAEKRGGVMFHACRDRTKSS